MKFLKLTLNAPLQSWGEYARWDVRDTASMPSKSAIIGLLGSCMGYPRGDDRLCALSSKLHMAVRADRPGCVMTDYHTVYGTNGILRNASGGKRSGGTIVTPRKYLQDAYFSVFLWGEEAVLEQCETALRHPYWITFLGRKSCVPAIPLLPKVFEADSIDEAVCKVFCGEEKYLGKIVQVQIEMLFGETAKEWEQVIERRDEVVSGEKNVYQTRRIRVIRLCRKGEGYVFE